MIKFKCHINWFSLWVTIKLSTNPFKKYTHLGNLHEFGQPSRLFYILAAFKNVTQINRSNPKGNSRVNTYVHKKYINTNIVKLNAVRMMQVNLSLINSASSAKGIGLKPKIEWLLKANINSTAV